ncbi:MAG: efflux RND transporter periplasmic adaptor subunit [Terrimicrobiaceae bacterium]|nr:efflux RND transporter periplasmic adaptor subunit [Terrimicrobiaceae bacterium]
MKAFSRTLWVLSAVGVLFAVSCREQDSRTPKFYQSPMHPWITSDKPGACTICGMQLVPVYEDSDPALTDDTLKLSAQTREVVGLRTAEAKVEPLRDEIRLSGILEDDDTRHRVVAAFYEGRIDRVYVQQVGERVSAGQPLAAIYSPELLYVVREYQNAITRGKNDPVAANARLRLIQFGLAPAQVDALARRDREVYTIDVLAPADGTVLVRNAWQGQYVKNGEPLFETGNLSRMWFQAEVYERDLPAIRLGQAARVVSPAAPGREFAGVVTFIDPSFDPATRSTKVRIEVDNPPREPCSNQRALPHRAFAEAFLAAETAPVLSIPRSALLRDGRREIVFVENEQGHFAIRAVKPGRVFGDRAEIVEGLQAGERVVAEGGLLLDAESQLRFGSSVPTKRPPPSPDLAAFFGSISEISAALSNDDLNSAKQAAKKLTPVSSEHEAHRSGEMPSVPPDGDSLEAFRAAFLPWALFAVAQWRAHASHSDLGEFRAFECPMTGSAFENAPPTATWLQASAEIANPYFGKAMRDCGSEVRP